MKRVLTLVLALALAFVSCTKESKDEPYNPDGSLITQAQALEIVKEDIDQYDVVYVSKSIVKKGTKFRTFGDRYGQVPCDSWVVIINTEPSANSGPYWLYIYVDPYSGNSDRDSWEWGDPENIECDIIKYDLTKDSVGLSSVSAMQFKPEMCAVNPASNNWAVIISGGYIPGKNFERYWNDCSAIYKCLKQVYNYRRDRILVLMSDGTSSGLDRLMTNGTMMSSPQDLDGDGTNDINYSATRSNLSKVFNYLKGQVKSDEQVFVFVTDHGDISNNNESFMWLWNSEKITASEFAKEIKKIGSCSRIHVVLGQCFSGGFIDPLLSSCSNISVAAASEANEESYAMSPDYKYDEFLYHWISAAAGCTPDGQTVDADKNGYPGVSAYEMFRYAKDNDKSKEKPQYSSKSESLGEEYGLSGEKYGYPVLSGPYDISSSSNNNRFELRELPSIDHSINWTSSSNISLTSNSQSVMARNVSVEAMEKGWVQAEIKTQFKTYTLWNRSYLWKPGIHTSDNLITGSLQECTFSLPYCVIGCNEYNWYISSRDYDDIQAESYFIEFTYTGDGNPGDYYVSVNFLNPLGEDTTIKRWYYD